MKSRCSSLAPVRLSAARRSVARVGATTIPSRTTEQAIVPGNLVDGDQYVAASTFEQTYRALCRD